MIRHCLLEHKQNIANAFNIQGVSSDFTLEEEGGVLGRGDLHWFLYISNYNVCICKTASLILKKKKKNKSLKSAANLNNSQNEEFCSSVKNFFFRILIFWCMCITLFWLNLFQFCKHYSILQHRRFYL